MFLWLDLADTFAYASSRSQAPVWKRLAKLRDLCNRIGHHHSIGSLDLEDRWNYILVLTGSIDPELRQ